MAGKQNTPDAVHFTTLAHHFLFSSSFLSLSLSLSRFFIFLFFSFWFNEEKWQEAKSISQSLFLLIHIPIVVLFHKESIVAAHPYPNHAIILSLSLCFPFFNVLSLNLMFCTYGLFFGWLVGGLMHSFLTFFNGKKKQRWRQKSSTGSHSLSPFSPQIMAAYPYPNRGIVPQRVNCGCPSISQPCDYSTKSQVWAMISTYY